MDPPTASLQVFISHSSTDATVARRLAGDLKAYQLKVWLDQWKLGVGQEIATHIERGVDEADVVIVLLSEAAVASEWVNREWRRKVEAESRSERLAVLPVRVERCELPDYLAQRSYVDLSGGSYAFGFRHLLEILQYHAPTAQIPLPELELERPPPAPDHVQLVTPIALEVSHDLISFVDDATDTGARFYREWIPRLRGGLEELFGFRFPGIRVRGNESDMPAGTALILIDEIPETLLRLPAGPVDPPAWLYTELRAVLRRMAPGLLDIQGVFHLVEALQQREPELVAKVIPARITYMELTEVLQRLVAEQLGVGDLSRILRTLAEHREQLSDTLWLSEKVRMAYREEITARHAGEGKTVPVILFDPVIEADMSSVIQQTGAGAYLHLDPEVTQNILAAVRRGMAALGTRAAGVPLLTVSTVRPFLRKLIELEFPQLQVIAHEEIAEGFAVEPVMTFSY